MPGLLKFLYEQLSYHKILPFVCNLSMKISLHRVILVKHVLARSRKLTQHFTVTTSRVWSEAGEAVIPVR